MLLKGRNTRTIQLPLSQIKASERNRYWNDPAVRLAKRAGRRDLAMTNMGTMLHLKWIEPVHVECACCWYLELGQPSHMHMQLCSCEIKSYAFIPLQVFF